MRLLEIENKKTTQGYGSFIESVHVSFENLSMAIFPLFLKTNNVSFDILVDDETVEVLLKQNHYGEDIIVEKMILKFDAPVRAFIDLLSGFPELVVFDFFEVEENSKINYTKITF